MVEHSLASTRVVIYWNSDIVLQGNYVPLLLQHFAPPSDPQSLSAVLSPCQWSTTYHGRISKSGNPNNGKYRHKHMVQTKHLHQMHLLHHISIVCSHVGNVLLVKFMGSLQDTLLSSPFFLICSLWIICC